MTGHRKAILELLGSGVNCSLQLATKSDARVGTRGSFGSSEQRCGGLALSMLSSPHEQLFSVALPPLSSPTSSCSCITPLMCLHCYFCSQNKIAGKITCKRQVEVCLQRFKQRCGLSRLRALHWGGRGHPSGVRVVFSWVPAGQDLFLAPPWVLAGAPGALRMSHL